MVFFCVEKFSLLPVDHVNNIHSILVWKEVAGINLASISFKICFIIVSFEYSTLVNHWKKGNLWTTVLCLKEKCVLQAFQPNKSVCFILSSCLPDAHKSRKGRDPTISIPAFAPLLLACCSISSSLSSFRLLTLC